MLDDRSILFVETIGNGMAFGKDFVIEFDRLVGRAVNTFAGDVTDNVGKFGRIVLQFSIFEFFVESFTSTLFTLTSNLSIQGLDMRIPRVGGAKSVTLASSFRGMRR